MTNHTYTDEDSIAYRQLLREARADGLAYAQQVQKEQRVRSPRSNYREFDHPELEARIPSTMFTHIPEVCGCVGMEDYALTSRVDDAWQFGWLSAPWPEKYSGWIAEEIRVLRMFFDFWGEP